METSPVRILVVDDSPIFRRFVHWVLGQKQDLQVIGEASDGLEAVQKAEELKPDLILLDIGLPRMNGIEAAKRILQVSPDTKILFLSMNSDADVVRAALDTGAMGYVLKSDAGTELWPAIEAVFQGKQYVSRGLVERLALAIPNGQNVYLPLRSSQVITDFLRAAMDASAADFGAVQLFDSTNCVLRIAAQHGFDDEFLNHFANARDSEHACEAAMRKRARVIVSDVASSPMFRGASRSVLLQAGVRSMQSTPLVDASGRFFGVLCTHHRRLGPLSQAALRRIDHVIQRYLPQLPERAGGMWA